MDDTPWNLFDVPLLAPCLWVPTLVTRGAPGHDRKTLLGSGLPTGVLLAPTGWTREEWPVRDILGPPVFLLGPPSLGARVPYRVLPTLSVFVLLTAPPTVTGCWGKCVWRRSRTCHHSADRDGVWGKCMWGRSRGCYVEAGGTWFLFLSPNQVYDQD